MKKKTKLKEIVFPNKKINFFITSMMILGIISGAIFLMILSKTDKNNVILQITNFFKKIANNGIDKGQAFRNSLIINYLFIVSIWILGFSIIGIFINILITYIKGFLVGFSVASIFLTFGVKGLIANILYVLPAQIINIMIVMMLSIYSIMLTYNLIRIIVSKKGNNRLMLKKYCVIFMFAIILSFISSIMESYLFPSLLKVVIKLYVS